MNKPQDFWSRRKAAVLSEQEALARAEEVQAEELRSAQQAEKSDAEILEELELPDPDSLKAGDDFSAFMAKAVPDRIRRRALRRLWLSDPALANLDGLLDYGEDFTDSATVIENLQTAYQVGKGMMAHVEEMLREEPEEQLPPAEQDQDDLGQQAGTSVAETIESDDASSTGAMLIKDTAEGEPNMDEMDDDQPSFVPLRRMHFVFGDECGERA